MRISLTNFQLVCDKKSILYSLIAVLKNKKKYKINKGKDPHCIGGKKIIFFSNKKKTNKHSRGSNVVCGFYGIIKLILFHDDCVPRVKTKINKKL